MGMFGFPGLTGAPPMSRMTNPFRLPVYGTKGYASTQGDVFKTTQPGPPVSDVLNSAQVANGNKSTSTLNPQQPATPYDVYSQPGSPQASGVTPPKPGGPPSAVDYSQDPILQKIKALGVQNIGDAVQTANAAQKQSLIGFGDPNLARTAHYFNIDPNQGNAGDESTAQAAAQNPLSTIAQLALQHLHQNANIDESTNKANLYYGSEHANELAGEAQNYLASQAAAQQQEQQQLGQIAAAVLAARQGAQGQQLQGEQDAYSRALQAALAGGFGGATTPSVTTPSVTTGSDLLPIGGTTPPPSGGSLRSGQGLLSATDPLTALMLAASNRRMAAV